MADGISVLRFQNPKVLWRDVIHKPHAIGRAEKGVTVGPHLRRVHYQDHRPTVPRADSVCRLRVGGEGNVVPGHFLKAGAKDSVEVSVDGAVEEFGGRL